MSQSLLNKVWSFLAVVLLYLSLNVWSITQQWQLTLPGNPFRDCKISAYGVTVYGIPLCGILLILTSIISILYARRSLGKTWTQRFPRFADFELDLTKGDALAFQAVTLVALAVVPSIGSVHFLLTMMNGTVYRGDQHFASGWREQLFKLPSWQDVKAGLFTYDKTVVCDNSKAALSFLPFWLPWLFTLFTAAVGFFVLWSLVEVFRAGNDQQTMDDPRIAEGIARNKAEKKARIDRNRPAFTLWSNLAELLEESVVLDRTLESSFPRALDLLFIKAFKSHGSLYTLGVIGHGEDAATIARRLFEIALQVGYLCKNDAEKENRGRMYLAQFWHNAKELSDAMHLNLEKRKWWEERYDEHKKWLRFKNGRPDPYWSGLNFYQLAVELGFKDTYEQDYRLLSNIAHCSARGLLLEEVDKEIQIQTDQLITPILVYGTKYMLWVTAHWNEHFKLIDELKLQRILDEAVNFDFRATV
jgi:hypothetical protein